MLENVKSSATRKSVMLNPFGPLGGGVWSKRIVASARVPVSTSKAMARMLRESLIGCLADSVVFHENPPASSDFKARFGNSPNRFVPQSISTPSGGYPREPRRARDPRRTGLGQSRASATEGQN